MLRKALVLVVVLAVGCGSDGVSKKDKDSAREAVETGLAAWKKGEKMNAITAPEPLQFADDDWQRGWKLTDYEIGKVFGQPDGFPRCHVTLNLTRRDGKTEKKAVTYQVVLRPKRVVSLDPFN